MLFLVLAAFALIYLGLPSCDYYFDGLTFAMAVEGVAAGGDPAWLFHPHHLLYSPLAYLFYRAFLLLGFAMRAVLAMHILSAFLALLGLGLFYRLLRRMDIPAPRAIAGTVLLGVSYNYWHFATQGETTIPTTVALLGLFNLAAESPRKSVWPRACGLGFLAGFAFLMHQTAALCVPAAGFLFLRPLAPSRRLAAAAVFVLCAAAIVLLGYLLVAAWLLDLNSPKAALAWLQGYFGPDPRTGYRVEYAAWNLESIPAAMSAWATGLVGNWAGSQTGTSKVWLWASRLIWTVTLLAAAQGARRAFSSRLSTASRRILQALLIFLVLHAIFFTWWKAGHVRFWLLALPAWLGLAAAGLADGLNWRRRRLLNGRPAIWGLAAALAAVVWAGPFRVEIRPERNRFLRLSGILERNSEPNGTVIISGVGEYGALKAYVPYFARRKMLILDWQFADKSVPPERALADLAARIEALRRREPVYLFPEVLDPALDGHFERFHGVPPGELRRIIMSMQPGTVCVAERNFGLMKL